MKITFKGVPGEDIDRITQYGITFERGKAVEVDGRQHAFAARKLSNHPHFEVEGGAEDAKLSDPLRVDAGRVHAAQATQALAASAVSMGAAGLLDQQAQAGTPTPQGSPDPQALKDAAAVNDSPLPEPGSPDEREKLEARLDALGVRVDKRWGIERLRSEAVNASAATARQAGE